MQTRANKPAVPAHSDRLIRRKTNPNAFHEHGAPGEKLAHKAKWASRRG